MYLNAWRKLLQIVHSKCIMRKDSKEYSYRLLMHFTRDRNLVRYFLCMEKVSKYTANICTCASNVLLLVRSYEAKETEEC